MSGTINGAKTERKLSKEEKEIFGQVKIELEKNLGLSTEFGSLENLAQWIGIDGTIEMLDVFARGEINKENYIIFKETESVNVKKELKSFFDLKEIEKNLKKYVSTQKENSKNFAEKRVRLLKETITRNMNNVSENIQYLTKLPVYVKEEKSPDDCLILDLYLTNQETNLGNIGILAKEIAEGNYKLSKQTVFFDLTQIEKIKEEMKIAICVYKTFIQQIEERLEKTEDLKILTERMESKNKYQKDKRQVEQIQKKIVLLFENNPEIEYSPKKGFFLETPLENYSKLKTQTQIERTLSRSMIGQINKCYNYYLDMMHEYEDQPVTEEHEELKAKLTKFLKDDNLL